MQFIQKNVRYFKQAFSNYAQAVNYNRLATGIIGTFGHPIYWLWWTYIDRQPHENLLMRMIGMVVCALLLLRKFWPVSVERFYSGYYFLAVAYTLPFFFTYYLIASHYSIIWSMAEATMLLLAMSLLSSLIVWVINIILGVSCAILLAMLTGLQLAPNDSHAFLYTYFPVYAFAICSGMALHYHQIKGVVALQKLAAQVKKSMALQALSGSIAHEMRNPLSQIKSSLDGVEKHLPLPNSEAVSALSPQQLKNLYEYVGIGGSAIKRGLQVIAMILDEVKDKPIDRQAFNYLHTAQATQKAIAEYGYETEGERHKIHLEVKRDFIFKGDETLYLFVLFNLIKNALYYFKLEPQAKLTITVSQPYVIVRDTGPGIANEHLPFLFDSFQTSGKQGGTGLGLAYCKRVMQAFGGDIGCHSLLGQYTEFILTFPEVSTSTWQHYQSGLVEHLRPLLYNKKVLVVDDDETIRASTQKILSDMGMQVDQAENGQQALQQLEKYSYDLMLLDLNMPVLNGYATAEKIRSGLIVGHAQIPIIAHTTEVAYMAQVKTQKVGINAFVSKPCEPLVLMQTIEQVLIQKPLVDPLADQINSPLVNSLVNPLANRSSAQEMSTFSSLCGKTILIVDDSETNRELIKHALEKQSIYILEAAHGQAAIDQLEQSPECAAVLMDIHMPGLNGLEASRLIRSRSSAYQFVPIIAITGDTDTENIQAAFASGMNDYIVKPIDGRVLLKKLNLLCNRKQEIAAEMPLFDFERLDYFKKNGIFKDGVDNSYVRQTTEHLIVLEKRVQSQDFEGIQDSLHFLKGSSFTIGAQALGHLVKSYEQQTKKGDWPDDEYWLEKVKSLHGRTLDALQVYFELSRSYGVSV